MEIFQRDLLGMMMVAIDENDSETTQNMQKGMPSKVQAEITDALKALKNSKNPKIAKSARQNLKGEFDGLALKEALKQIEKNFHLRINITFKRIDMLC